MERMKNPQNGKEKNKLKILKSICISNKDGVGGIVRRGRGGRETKQRKNNALW